ncbi:MAG: TetR/AcrR family transcriptional regulator [Solirubrobacteraceae bacterium]|nr:TetR/AcrR family transcriptional regulator [Solirubrobacteraceae bacterium]
MATRPASSAAADKRRLILDAAIRVFAARGFNNCRVSDIADEAGVAYGLVYHYFKSKDRLLDEAFLERWGLMLEVIEGARTDEALTAREKLTKVATFIVESYGREPEVMQVVIVEVTRQANTFGRRHWATIQDAHHQIARIVSDAQARGELRSELPAEVAGMVFYGAIEQVLTAWIFGLVPSGPDDRAAAVRDLVETIFGGLDAR